MKTPYSTPSSNEKSILVLAEKSSFGLSHRESIQLIHTCRIETVASDFEGKKVLIFGGSGSLGRTLIKRWVEKNSLVVFSRDEAKHWTIRNEMQNKSNLKFCVGDIRDSERVLQVLREVKPNLVVIAAALKQVDTCELSPEESIKTNVIGIANILNACSKLGHEVETLETVLMVSTDKACSPTNVYGMSKAIAERLVVSHGRATDHPRFIGVRYGNVLESRGSIVPLFKYQAESMPFFTITHNAMTRFLMTLDESIDLIESAIEFGSTGEFWIPKLRSMNVIDLARIFSERYKKPIMEIGIRHGEKLHEYLISETESLRTENRQGRIVLKPDLVSTEKEFKMWHYSSDQDLLDEKSLNIFLESKGVFEKASADFTGNTIEEIRKI